MQSPKSFLDLSLPEQAAIILVTIMDDVASGKRTLASVEHHIGELYEILAVAWNVPEKEVAKVAEAVASKGVEMLPAFPKEMIGEQTEAQADGSGD